jgi:hypothetical protein
MAVKILGVEASGGLEERGSATTNGKYKYYTAEEVAKLGVSAYTEINISSDEILDGHNTSIPLVSTIKENKDGQLTGYWKDLIICFEFTGGTTPYLEAGAGVRSPRISYSSKGGEYTVILLEGLNMLSVVDGAISHQIVRLSDVESFLNKDNSISSLNFSTDLQLINGNGTLKVKVSEYIENVG